MAGFHGRGIHRRIDMWNIFQAEDKPEVQALRQERDGLVALVKDVASRYEAALLMVKSEFIKFAAQYKLDKLCSGLLGDMDLCYAFS